MAGFVADAFVANHRHTTASRASALFRIVDVSCGRRRCDRKAGDVVEVDVCPKCGVYVKSKAIGLDDEGAWMIPSALAELQD